MQQQKQRRKRKHGGENAGCWSVSKEIHIDTGKKSHDENYKNVNDCYNDSVTEAVVSTCATAFRWSEKHCMRDIAEREW